jgi:hypothetical protein
MAHSDIAHERLLRQRIAGMGLEGPADVVRWMGAVQSQDYAGGKWAIGLRCTACTDNDVEEAFNRGEIVRTHVMRPTWHFILPEDLRWMQSLMATRVNALNAYYYRQLELDSAVFKRSSTIIKKALRGGKQLTRAELGVILGKAGIVSSDLRIGSLMLRAELDAVICSGGRRGKQFTYTLVEDRAPHALILKRDEALAKLTERYFTSHGPATIRDFCWWSGLSTVDAKAGLQMLKNKLISEDIDGQKYWLAASAPAAKHPRRSVYLLPDYDEYIVGYTDRRAVFDAAHAEHSDERRNPLFDYTIVSDGQIIGTWKRSLGKASVAIAPTTFIAPGNAEARGILQAAKRFGEFVGLPVEFREFSLAGKSRAPGEK